MTMNRTRIGIVAFTMTLLASAVQAQNPALGTWEAITVSPDGEFKSILEITEERGELKALVKSPLGERRCDSIDVDGDKITVVMKISYNGTPVAMTYSGKIEKDKIKGDVDYGSFGKGTWSATLLK